MSTIANLNVEQLRKAVRDEYAAVARDPAKGHHFHTGRPLARMLGYNEAAVAALPDSVVESFAGVGNPFALGSLHPGEVVADLGSGAGFDSILAAQQVGPSGRVIGIDMTPAMLEKARGNAQRVGLANVEFRQGYLETIPLEDATADVVISNGVINLCPDKVAVWDEIFRILKPGGRIQIADIIVSQEVPEAAKENIELWTG